MKKFFYTDIEKIGYRPFIELMVTELNEAKIKPRDFDKFLFNKDDPESSFMGAIVVNYNAIEYLKESGLLNNGICPMCGRRPIDGKFTFTSGTNRDIKFNICQSCYKVGNQSSLNPANKEGCFIATLCYGDYDSKEVILFRNYRDNYLKKSDLGRLFITIYYWISPVLIRIIGKNETVILFIRNHFLQNFYIYLLNKSQREE